MYKLYDFLPSGNGYKVRLLLAQLGIAFERIEIDILQGESRTPEFLEKNPNGRIPVLELEPGVYLSERAETIRQMPDESFSHPLNPNSEIHGVALGDLTGLKRLGFYLVQIPPDKESFIYHSHEGEEEFIYILLGRGIAEINGEEFEVSAGDFMGFPTPSVGHHLRNPFAEPLVYLMGGERHPLEVADFPKLEKRLIRNGNQVQLVNWQHLNPLVNMPQS